MAETFDDSKGDYQNRFKEENRWSKILFHPTRPLFQSELNELQSGVLSQIKLLGDTSFKGGSVISGMNLISKGKVEDNTEGKGQKSLVSLSDISSSNTRIDSVNYPDNGKLTVYSTASLATSQQGIKFKVVPSDKGDLTLSYSIQVLSGTLYRPTVVLPEDLIEASSTIDGKNVYKGLTVSDTTPLQDADGNQFNLNDNKPHQIATTVKGSDGKPVEFSLLVNTAYDALKEGRLDFELDAFKVETGDTVTSWEASETDKNVSTGFNRNQRYIVTNGLVYLGGMIRHFNETEINLSGTGKEVIGLSLEEDIITADMDPTLLDHTTGTASQWKPGADRLHYNVTLTYNDDSSVALYQLLDGKVVNDPSKPQESIINDILAKRTNDESGSYAVNGFDIWSEPNLSDSSVVDVIVDSGEAYVLGYQVNKTTSTRLQVPKSVGTADIADEVFIYSNAIPDNGLLANQPVKTVSQVTGNVQIKDESVSRSATSTTNDTLSQQAYIIDEVYSLDDKKAKTTYIQGVDFSLVNGNELKWLVTDKGKEPATGTTYYVSYKYEKTFVVDKDYKIVTAGADETADTTITFAGLSGDKPVENSQVHVSYTYFLARIDMLTLNKDGVFTVVSGQPDKLSEAQPPAQIDPMTLRIGFVTVFPNSTKAITQKSTITRIPFTGLQDMSSRINDLEYNLAVQELRFNAMQNQDPVTLKNTFSDDFSNISKADSGNKGFSAAYVPADPSITVDNKAASSIGMTADVVSSNFSQFKHTWALPYTEKTLVSQLKATNAININPYSVFNVLGQMSLTPDSDNWIDEKSNTVEKNTDVNLGNGFVTWGAMNNALTSKGYTLASGDPGYGGSWSAYAGYQHKYVKTTNTYSDTETEAEFLRSITVTFEADNLIPLDDNLELSFDGQHVDIVPATGYKSGTTKGTIMSDGGGTVKGTFVIPSGVRVGTREVKLHNDRNTAVTTFTGSGLTKTHLTTITHEHATASYYDPLAQSFAAKKGSTITSADIYFAGIPDSLSKKRTDVIVQVRKMDDSGYPSRTIVAEGILHKDDIKASSDAQTGTRVTFKDPLVVSDETSYALVIITDSDAYSLYTAVNGQPQVGTNQNLVAPAYQEGMLFTSSNAQTWSALQDTSLKFSINGASFESKGQIKFNPINMADQKFVDAQGKELLDDQGKTIPFKPSQLIILSDYLTPDNTTLDWQYRVVYADQPNDANIESASWLPYTDNATFDFSKEIRTIQFQVILTGSNGASPYIESDNLALLAYLTGREGIYLSRDINMQGNTYNHLRTQYDAMIPAGATVTPQFSTDKGSTWKEYTNGKLKKVVIDRNYTRYMWDYQLTDVSAGDNTQFGTFKVRLALNADSAYLRPKVKNLMNSMSLQDGNETGNDGYEPVTGLTYTPTGTLVWSSDGATSDVSAKLTHPLSSSDTGIVVKVVDKFGNTYSAPIANADIANETEATTTIGKETMIIKKVSDSEVKVTGLKNLAPFEIDIK
ncbi:DUF4815 domain-containing protein [Secundilactobacillus kimchicus]|uniref:DUF4815 domain-containing protein n=1 Tax=Secundilactobacillus kimchicus TaxID=528209 RepID=UPI001C034880|nr:DUF4815 domain-containing protein [Secundilactobacillus kimchicus]